MTEPIELYRKYRPTKFKEVVGQNNAVRSLVKMVKEQKVPHALLFTGPSGTGKTTLARILRTKLGCDCRDKSGGDTDFMEVNAAQSRGVDTIRDIKMRMSASPINGTCRVWLLDECHKLTDEAQSALLKMLEDTPAHVYFMLATTDPGKLKDAIITRCTEIKLIPIPEAPLKELLIQVATTEQKTLSDQLIERIIECADGSGRKALVLLHQVLGIEDEQQRLDAILKSDIKHQSIELCQVLTNTSKKWKDAAEILLTLKGEEAESIRRLVLGWAAGGLTKRNQKLCYFILTCFEGDFFQSGNAGWASLVRASYEVMEKRG